MGFYMNELFLQDEDDLVLFPMSPKVIAEAQENCTVLKKQLKDKKNKKVYTKRFINEVELVFLNDKIYIPEKLRLKILNWYYHFLNHPRETRLEKTISKTMTWNGLTNHCKKHCR